MTKAEATEAIREIFSLPIHIHEATEDEALQAHEMAVDYAKGYYDMIYLRLAMLLNCQWCTDDRRVGRSVPQNFRTYHLLLLSNLR